MKNLISTPHHRFFSVEKANSSLVLVGPIAAELLSKYKRLSKVQFEIEALENSEADTSVTTAQEDANKSDEALLDRLYDEMHRLLDQISHNVEELHAIGCIFKDFQVGIVDFPTHFNGRDVYLCWQHGEIEITHWHEMEEGFSGRNAITDYFVKHCSAEAAVF